MAKAGSDKSLLFIITIMNITIRQEKAADFDDVFELIKKAFENIEMSDHKEQFLVRRLRD